MPKSKRPRKKHQRLAYRLDPFAMLRDHSIETLSATQLRDLMLSVHTSLKAIEEGKGTEECIISLAVASNIALILAEGGMGEEFIPEVKDAQRFIVELQALWNREHRAVLSGPGMVAIRRMLELHDEQIKHPDATEAKMRQAMRTIFARMQAGNVEIPA